MKNTNQNQCDYYHWIEQLVLNPKLPHRHRQEECMHIGDVLKNEQGENQPTMSILSDAPSTSLAVPRWPCPHNIQLYGIVYKHSLCLYFFNFCLEKLLSSCIKTKVHFLVFLLIALVTLASYWLSTVHYITTIIIIITMVHRCGPGGSMCACHAAGPSSIPGRDRFPGLGFSGFFLICKTNVGKL